MRHLQWALALTAVVWVGLIVITPWLPAPLAGSLYLFASMFCHQRAERSFHWGASQWLVCGRCTGIYAGAALGILMWAAPFGPRAADGPGAGSPRAGRWIGAALALPTVATFVVEWVLWNPGNLIRALAAAPFGAFIALFPLRRIRGGASDLRT